MLWIRVGLFLAALLVVGSIRLKDFRRHKTRYGGDSGHSTPMVVGDNSPAHVRDANAADWSGSEGNCGGGGGD
jgi:hypothetical protein